MTNVKVAFLGLGVMGYPMAGHLKAKGGHDVTVYNRTAAKAAKWAEQFGGNYAATPADAVKNADFVFACIGNDDDRSALRHHWRRWCLFHHEKGRNLYRQHHRIG